MIQKSLVRIEDLAPNYLISLHLLVQVFTGPDKDLGVSTQTAAIKQLSFGEEASVGPEKNRLTIARAGSEGEGGGGDSDHYAGEGEIRAGREGGEGGFLGARADASRLAGLKIL